MSQLQPNILTREFLIEWNYRFPVDKWWREKYHVPLFSEKHLSMSQLDIASEYYEELLFIEFQQRGELFEKKRKDYEAGILITREDNYSNKEMNDLFDKLDVSSLNKQNRDSQLQFEE